MSGRRCNSRLDGAWTRMTPKGRAERFCWNSRFRSMVTSTSWAPRIRRSSSSRRTRTAQERVACEVERSDGLLAPYRRELPEELVKGFAPLEVVEGGPHRDTGADEDRRSTEDVGIAVEHLAERRHADRPPRMRIFPSQAGARPWHPPQ